MKVSRSQKIFLAVLAMSVAALGVDWYFDAGHATSLGSAPGLSVVSTATGVCTTASQAEGSVDILEALNDLHRNRVIRDAFLIPAVFGTGDSDTAPDAQRAKLFQHAHALKAVISRWGRSTAIIDDKLLKVGDSLDGFRLESISKMSVVFNGGDIHLELQIEEPDGSGQLSDVK